MKYDKVSFINGSPRRGRSTSASIIEHMRNIIGGNITTSVIDAVGPGSEDGGMFDSDNGSHLMVLVSPLYVDSLPSGVLEMMLSLDQSNLKDISLLVIFNCGFPESEQNNTAIEICRNFAVANGMRWSGGLAIGGGGAIDGRPLSPNGPERNVVRALEMVCDSLLTGADIPEEVFILASRPFFPVWLYLLAANHQWKTRAKSRGAERPLKHRPYR